VEYPDEREITYLDRFLRHIRADSPKSEEFFIFCHILENSGRLWPILADSRRFSPVPRNSRRFPKVREPSRYIGFFSDSDLRSVLAKVPGRGLDRV
jgi:hypothetical protein